MDLDGLVVSHPEIGQLSIVEVARDSTIAITLRARATGGRRLEVTVGRPRAEPRPGGLAAFSARDAGGPVFRRSLTRSIIDAAIIAQAARLHEDGPSYHVLSHGLGSWVGAEALRPRPALVTDAVEGKALSTLDSRFWREEAWQVVPTLLAMIMVTPAGERASHRDLKASRVILGPDNQLRLVAPGVDLKRGEVEHAGFDVADDPAEEPWERDERVTLTTFGAYPTSPPGTAGADLQAIGLMVYEGLTGARPLGDESPAPRAYNYGLGEHGRGVPSARIIMGRIPPLRQQDPSITPEMETVVRALLAAPLGHELALGHGRSLRDWVSLCQAAAASVG